MFFPSNAHNSNVQSFPENKYSFTGRLNLCIVQRSNPCQQLGRLLCYHYSNDAERGYDQSGDFQKFQTLIFPCKFSECLIKKKSKLLFEKRNGFLANQTKLFLINRKLLFLVCFFSRSLESQKNDRKLLFHDCFVSVTHTIVRFNLSLKTNGFLPVV